MSVTPKIKYERLKFCNWELSFCVITLFIPDAADMLWYSLGNLELKEKAGSPASVAVKIQLCSEMGTGVDCR